MHYDYGRLLVLCERSSTLPQLPASVFRLMEVLESVHAPAIEIEKIVISDPMLCMRLLRLASNQMGNGERLTSVRSAVLRLGQRAVRSLAISLGMEAMFTSRQSESLFDPMGFAQHSILVGLMARYTFARRQMSNPADTNWSNEEVFAAGVLHDMPMAILSWVAPPAYNRVHLLAKGHGMTFEMAFQEVFGGSVRELGRRAVRTWGLPEMFAHTIEHVDQPWETPKEQIPLMAIHYASAIADSSTETTGGFGAAPWGCAVQVAPEVTREVALPEEEVVAVLKALMVQTEQYLPEKSMKRPMGWKVA